MNYHASRGLATALVVFVCAALLLIPRRSPEQEIPQPSAPPPPPAASIEEPVLKIDAPMSTALIFDNSDTSAVAADLLAKAVVPVQFYTFDALVILGSVGPDTRIEAAVDQTVELGARFRNSAVHPVTWLEDPGLDQTWSLASNDTAEADPVSAPYQADPDIAEHGVQSEPDEREPVRATSRMARETLEGAHTHEDYDQYLTATINRRARDLQHCYQRLLRTDAALGGRLSVSFTIDEEGAVTDIEVPTNELGDQFSRCVELRIGNWSFDPPGMQVTVWKSYLFTTAGS